MKAEQYQTFHDTKNKLEKIIDSCETHQHIISTRRYFRLWEKYIKRELNLNGMWSTNYDLYISFSTEVNIIGYLIENKSDEILKKL
jgi:hypothetical protein